MIQSKKSVEQDDAHESTESSTNDYLNQDHLSPPNKRHPITHQNSFSYSMHGCSLGPDNLSWDVDKDDLVKDFHLNDENISIGGEVESLSLQKVSGYVYGGKNKEVAGTEIHLINVGGKRRDDIMVKADENGSFLFKNVLPGTYRLEKIGSSQEESLLVDVWDGEDVENVIFCNTVTRTNDLSFPSDRIPLPREISKRKRKTKSTFMDNRNKNLVDASVADSMHMLSFGPENSTWNITKAEDLRHDTSDSDVSFNDDTDASLEVSGFVYNINGIGVDNVNVQLIDTIRQKENKLFEKTDSNGCFSFHHVSRGTYILRVEESSLPNVSRLPRNLLKSKVIDMWSGTDFEGFVFGNDPNSIVGKNNCNNKTGESVQLLGLVLDKDEERTIDKHKKNRFQMSNEQRGNEQSMLQLRSTISLDDSIDGFSEERERIQKSRQPLLKKKSKMISTIHSNIHLQTVEENNTQESLEIIVEDFSNQDHLVPPMKRHPVTDQSIFLYSMHGCSLGPDNLNWDVDKDDLVKDFHLNDDNISIGNEVEYLPLQKVSGFVYGDKERKWVVGAELHLIDVNGIGRGNIIEKTGSNGSFVFNDVQCGTYILEKIATKVAQGASLLVDVWDGEDVENVIFGDNACAISTSLFPPSDRMPLSREVSKSKRKTKSTFMDSRKKNLVDVGVADSMYMLSLGPEKSSWNVTKTEDFCHDNSDSDVSFNDDTDVSLKVSGFVYNINGIGVDNVNVQLIDTIGLKEIQKIQKMEKTDSNGCFSFHQVPRGTYILRVEESSLPNISRLPRNLLKSKVIDMWSGTDFEGFVFGNEPTHSEILSKFNNCNHLLVKESTSHLGNKKRIKEVKAHHGDASSKMCKFDADGKYVFEVVHPSTYLIYMNSQRYHLLRDLLTFYRLSNHEKDQIYTPFLSYFLRMGRTVRDGFQVLRDSTIMSVYGQKKINIISKLSHKD